MASKYIRLLKNIFLVFLGNIGSKIINLLMLPFYTKWLSPADYGLSDIIHVYVNIGMVLIAGGLTEAIFVFPKDKLFKKQSIYFSTGFVYSLLGFLITAVVLLFVRFSGINTDFFIPSQYLMYFYFIVLATFLQTFVQQFARSIDKMNIYVITGMVLTFLTATFSIILIPRYSIDGLLIAQICSFSVSFLFCFVSARMYRYFNFKLISRKRVKEMLAFSVPMMPNSLVWWLVNSLNRPLLLLYTGPVGVGLYAVANKIPTVMNSLFSIFQVSWQVSVLEEFKKENYKEFYNRIFKCIFTLLLFFCIGLTVFSRFVIANFVDKSYYDAWRYIPFIALAFVFNSMSGFIGTNFAASKESKYFFYSSIYGAIVSVIFNFLLIPFMGLQGAAISLLVSSVVLFLSRCMFSKKYVILINKRFYFILVTFIFAVILNTIFTESDLFRNTANVLLIVLLLIYCRNVLLQAIKLMKEKIKRKPK